MPAGLATTRVVIPRNHGFQLYESGAVVGRIYWRVGNRFFPSRNWEDFPVPILSWWLAACRRHIARGTRQEFRFMDGPYVIRISAAGAQTSELAFCRETDTTEALIKSRLNKLMLRETLVAAAEEVLSVCKRANMASADIDSLANELTKLRR